MRNQSSLLGLSLIAFGLAIFFIFQAFTVIPPVIHNTNPISPAVTPADTLGETTQSGYLVTKAIDGDTIEIEGGERVRLIGVDTPETVDPRRPVGCFGKEASNVTKSLVEGKKVKMESDITDRDKYGRLLRYVWVNNIFINEYLVREGFANSSSYPPDVKYQGLFDAAEIEARENKRGLWESCKI
jgi:endonuclease YncB( thermonuclease family)